ncbi:MAG: hypothetical protein JXA81_06935 [Sedimentisphaerales bacterium]|nr:hypothetical protein [Sedimentisphaerales bacterium]
MSTLHYRCSFNLTAECSERSWEMLLKEVRKWIAKRPKPHKENDFWKAWFFQGGLWKSQIPTGIRILTRYCYGNCSNQSPNCWAAEYEHPCDEFPGGRFWRVHIGIEQFDRNQFQFNFQTLYDMRPGYLGLEPRAPLPSAPGLITTLLRSNSWRCTAGAEKLSTLSKVLRVGEGHLFAKLLTNNQRTCPVVLLSQTYPDKGYLLNGTALAKLLSGTAIVYQSESSEVDEELDNLFGERFGCRKGMIRIYFPGLDFRRVNDEKRHRFILPRDIESWGVNRTTEIVVTGIARRSTRPKGVLTPLDVEAVNRQRRLVQLRTQQSSISNDELIQLLEEENENLRTEKVRIENEKSKIEDDNLLLEERIDSLEDDNRRLAYDKDALKANLSQTNVPTNKSKLETVFEKIKELPETLSEVVELIKAFHPERIAFTKRAIKSAHESKFDDVNRAWKVLWVMATTLYDLHFERVQNDIPKVFRDETGIELAMTERKITKKDNRNMTQRKDTFKGQKIDITPHVKFDAESTRAYFNAFRQNGTKLIVVGYIGHLRTQGSSKRQRS